MNDTNAQTIHRVMHEIKRRKLEVLRVVDLTPRMRRITVGGPELAGFISVGSDDPAVREEVLQLLRSQTVGLSRVSSRLDTALARALAPELGVGERLGPWRLTERIARSVPSACSRCSISQREYFMPTPPPRRRLARPDRPTRRPCRAGAVP